MARVSVVNDAALMKRHLPSLTLSQDLMADSRFLQFEISGASGQAIARSLSLEDGTLVLDFCNGLCASLETSTNLSHQHLLSKNAATIDLRAQPYYVNLDLSIYRDAGLDSELGFYRTDTAEGAITTDPLLGITLMLGDEGYLEAALSQQSSSTFKGEDGASVVDDAWLFGRRFTSMFLVVDSPNFDGPNLDSSTV